MEPVLNFCTTFKSMPRWFLPHSCRVLNDQLSSCLVHFIFTSRDWRCSSPNLLAAQNNQHISHNVYIYIYVCVYTHTTPHHTQTHAPTPHTRVYGVYILSWFRRVVDSITNPLDVASCCSSCFLIRYKTHRATEALCSCITLIQNCQLAFLSLSLMAHNSLPYIPRYWVKYTEKYFKWKHFQNSKCNYILFMS